MAKKMYNMGAMALLIAVVAIVAVTVCLSADTTAQAAPDTLTVDGSIWFVSAPSVGNAGTVRAKAWQSADRLTWDEVALSTDGICLIYRDDNGQPLPAAPQDEGDYTVALEIGTDYTDTRWVNRDNKVLSAGDVIATCRYRIVRKQFAILFAPSQDVLFDGTDHYTTIVEGTTPLYAGSPLSSAAYTVAVTDKDNNVVDRVIDPGEYHVVVTLTDDVPDAQLAAGDTFRSAFAVTSSLAELVSIRQRTIYAGMYTGGSDADRTAYYTPTLAGALVEAYAAQLDVSYRQQWRSIALPTEAGDYLCRVRVTSDIPQYGLVAGDYIDLPYTVTARPYSVEYKTTSMFLYNGTSSNSKPEDGTANYIAYTDAGFSLLTPVFYDINGKHIDINAAVSRLYVGTWDETTCDFVYAAAESLPADGIRAYGRYKVEYQIDCGDSGRLTGANYFTEKAKDYCIDASNNTLTMVFDVVGNYTVSPLKSQYFYTGSPLALNPDARFGGASAGSAATVSYYKDGAAIAADQVGMTVGEYLGVIRFGDWSVNSTVITRADQNQAYWFSFDVVPQEIGAQRYEDTAASDAVDALLTAMDLSAADVDVAYYRNNSGFYTTLTPSIGQTVDDLFTTVGEYRVDVSATHGPYAGYTVSMTFVVNSGSHMDNIAITLPALSGGSLPYTGAPVAATVDMGAAPATAYSVLYEAWREDSWQYCDYPVMPGRYRVRVRLNEASSYFGAPYGAQTQREFTIEPIAMSVDFVYSADSDHVYDGQAKTFDVQLYAKDLPFTAEEMESFAFHTVYAPVAPDGTVGVFADTAPVNAGRYRSAVLFDTDDYRQYGLSLKTDTDMSAQGLTGHAVPATTAITVDRLALDVVADIEVEERGMYRLDGSAVLPALHYYRGNDSVAVDAQTAMAGQSVDGLISTDCFDTLCLRGELNAEAFNDEPIAEPKQTGKYRYILTLKPDVAANVYIGQVFTRFVGAKEDVSYPFYTAAKVKDTDTAMQVVYAINPLPLTVKGLDKYYDASGMYYGEAHATTVDTLRWYTVDRDGTPYLLDDAMAAELATHVTVTYYERLTGSTSYSDQPLAQDGNAALPADYTFAMGTYLMRVDFLPTATESDSRLYSIFTPVGGKTADGVAMQATDTLTGGSFVGVELSVLQAQKIRAVFERNFDTFTEVREDGKAQPKTFTVRFVTRDGTDVTAELTGAYRMSYYYASGVEMKGAYPATEGDYYIQINFVRPLYRYAIEQNEGVYSRPDAAYIGENDTVKLAYSITQGKVLSWEWTQGDRQFDKVDATGYEYYRYAYDGLTKPYSVRFFLLADAATTVNLIPDVDYSVRYYRQETVGASTRYRLVEGAPTEIGEYVVEIVFTRDLADYRAVDGRRIYSYTYADTAGGYGRSLQYMNGVLSVDLCAEYRYIQFAIDPAAVSVQGAQVADKAFDNTANAEVSGALSLVATTGALVEADIQPLRTLLSLATAGRFAQINVGRSITVQYGIDVGNGMFVAMPHQSLVPDGNGIAYVRQQVLAAWEQASALALDGVDVSDALSLLDTIAGLLDQLEAHYDFVLQNVTAAIEPALVTVVPDPFERTYNPYYEDARQPIPFRLPAAQLALLQSLSISGMQDAEAADYFVGELTHHDPLSVAVGVYKIVPADSFGWIDVDVELADGTIAKLSALVQYTVADADYTVLPAPVTLGVTGGEQHRYYDEADTPIEVSVLAGTLFFGDTLDCNDEHAPVRDTRQAMDDCGRYRIDLTPVRIVNDGVDVSDNYAITYEQAWYCIDQRTIYITPVFASGTHYYQPQMTEYATGYNVRIQTDGVQPQTFDLASIGAEISGAFGYQETETNDAKIYKSYLVTMGTIGIKNIETGKNISGNFVIKPLSGVTYVINKYYIHLRPQADSYTKLYGQPDPVLALDEVNNSMSQYGFVLAPSSCASRESGENVGTYKLLRTNEGTITILDDKGKDVTEYCYVEVDNTRYENQQAIEYTLQISPRPITVSVRNASVVKTNQAIIPAMQYTDSDGSVISASITATLRVRYGVAADYDYIEGDNLVTPQIVGDVQTDDNFIITVAPGVITVVYPQNHVSVRPLEDTEEVVDNNRYAFVGGRLYRSIQMYSLKTDNGENPTRTLDVVLPVTDSIVYRDVYVIAVHKDGSYHLLDARMVAEGLQITDDEFYYIMIAQPENWPFIVLGVVLGLAVIAGIAIVIRVKSREKVRGKKPKTPKEPKPPKIPKPNKTKKPVGGEQTAVVPVSLTETVIEDTLPAEAMPATDQGAIEPIVDTLPPTETVQSPEAAAPQESKALPKKAKGASKSAKGKRGNDHTPVGYVPSAKPTATTPPVMADDTLPADGLVASLDESAIGAGSIPATSGLGAMDGDDDIIISSSSRRRVDDEDNNE